MIRVLKYASKEFQLILQDSEGNEIDPTTLVRIKVFIYSQGFVEIAKFFYSDTEPLPSGYIQASLVDSSVASNAITCILNSSVTGAAKPGQYTIQITWTDTDARFENNEETLSNKGDFLIIEKAMN